MEKTQDKMNSKAPQSVVSSRSLHRRSRKRGSFLSLAYACLSLPVVAQNFPFPDNFDPTDIPLMFMRSAGVDLNAAGIDETELRNVLRERMAQTLASGTPPMAPPFALAELSAQVNGENKTPPVAFERIQKAQRERMMQEMLDELRATMEVSDDAEWELIRERIERVIEAKRAAASDGLASRSPMASFANPTSVPSPNVQRNALQKAVDSKAGRPQLERALEAYLADRASKEQDFAQARDDLRSILTLRQEAIASLAGIL